MIPTIVTLIPLTLAALAAVGWALAISESLRRRRLENSLREMRADRKKSIASAMSFVLHRISQPAFALKLGWEHIASLLERTQEIDPTDLKETLDRLVPIVTTAIAELNQEIAFCRQKVGYASIKPRLIEMAEVMEVVEEVKEYATTLGVRISYPTHPESPEGRDATSALMTTVYGDVEQLREIVRTFACYVAAFMGQVRAKTRLSILLSSRSDQVILRLYYFGFVTSRAELEADPNILHALRLLKNYGISIDFVDGFTLRFPKKTLSKIEPLQMSIA